jgi:hypothetical protein
MKTKIKVDIHKSGSENDQILEIVANTNSGKAPIELEDMVGYLKCRRANYPIIKGGVNCKVEDSKLHITEDDGKTWTLTLEWTTVVELEPENTTTDEKANQ